VLKVRIGLSHKLHGKTVIMITVKHILVKIVIFLAERFRSRCS